jgi:gliding motility-associated-like protein
MVWNGSSWDGIVRYNVLERSPPPGCNNRAMWLGYYFWTRGGEGICLKLDKPIEAGKTYSYTFTYASDGIGSNGNFSPNLYTNNDHAFPNSVFVGRMPGANDWTTNTFTFTGQPNQVGHNWLIVHAYESSGTILGQCDVQELYPDEENLLGNDTLICAGDVLELAPPINSNYEYVWNTGSEDPSILVTDPGEYSVFIRYGDCTASSSIMVETEDCEVRLVMPNIFTPNSDSYNPLFIPKEHNYIKSGTTRIYNRWGNHIFTGDLFMGWGGKTDSGTSVSDGVYYFVIYYTDKNGKAHELRGPLTVTR